MIAARAGIIHPFFMLRFFPPHSPLRRFALPVVFTLLCVRLPARAASLYQNGSGGRAMSLGGTGIAVADDPLSALFDNPAALGDLKAWTLQAGVDGAFVQGGFHNRANGDERVDHGGAIGEFALAVPLGPVRFAVGINPDIAADVRWHYRDAPGGADGATSYGYQRNEASILLLRTAFGAGWQVLPTLSVGGGVGLLYNRNTLHTPYVFQTQPNLRTVKTLLDLDTDGLGWNLQGAVRWRPVPALSLNVVYTSRTRVETDGGATGNAGVQLRNLGLGAARPDFDYDAQVTNHFPQQVGAGVAWTGFPRWTLSAQFDWINWSDAFDTLPVRLTHGNNADLNGLVGSSRLNDDTPLRWRDQYVGRFGVERTFGDHWSARAGYAYGNNPVPPGTLTPLTAAVTEHLLTVGAGYHAGRYRLDAAFQWRLPATGRVRTSDLATGEYSNSVTEVTTESINLTASMDF